MITRVGTCEDKGKGLAFAYNLMRYKQKLPRMDKKESNNFLDINSMV
jgi:hypothetical protein